LFHRRRRTKIVATLGPASDSPEMLRRLMDAGVDVFRLNFAHGTQESHGRAIRLIRRTAAEADRPVAILQDLQGPKIRIGELAGHRPVDLAPGHRLRITVRQVPGTADLLSTTYEALPRDVRPGDGLLLDDGRIQLRVLDRTDEEVLAEVVAGGRLAEHKGINLPQTPLSAPCLTEKDLDDLRFGLEAGVDFVGLSFVRRAEDVEEVRRRAREAGADIPVIAKIERIEAVMNLEEIVSAADGVMVARGDLGVETSVADVPILQKRILSVAGRHGKVDITATQMLESMVQNPLPTRAEATDVANAVFDGTDALMLSEETAVGRYPVEAVRTMSEIALRAEEHLSQYGRPAARSEPSRAASVSEGTVHAACVAAAEVGARAIVVFTLSGRTAFLVAARRPSVPVFGFSPREQTLRRLCLAWGVEPVRTELVDSPDKLLALVEERLGRDERFRGGQVVMVTGTATVPGATNIMRIHRLGG